MELMPLISALGEVFNEAPKIITGLLFFPPLLFFVKWRMGKSKGWSDFLPSGELLRSYRNNFLLVLLNVFTWTALFTVFDKYLINFWEDTFGVARVDPFGTWPLFAQVIVLMFILDFTNYWSHRLLHRPWMWGIHSLHHSDEKMNFSTNFRVHGLEMVQMKLVVVVIIGWLSLPVAALAVAAFIRSWYGLYVHSRLPFDHGRFRKVLVSPNYHRWHHADDPAVYGKNLSDMFPVWDLAFGTHYDPGTCKLPQGVSDAPKDIWRAQWFPVTYLVALFKGRMTDPASPHEPKVFPLSAE